MRGFDILIVIAVALALLGLVEALLHRRNLRRIPIRIHVNGTRGKSSVTRLIAGGLRAGGLLTCAKTTGTLARMILPNGKEVPVFRPAKANVIEQIRIVSAAAAQDAQALVIECMALQPELQWLCEEKFVQATHGVITNARPDHLEVMGPDEVDVAKALAAITPRKGKLFTTERKHLEVLADAARDRQCELVAVDREAVSGITPEELARFSYTEHADNVALALRVCADLGVPRAVALKGMWAAAPDPGVLTEHELAFFGRRIVFVNGFAANDPISTEMIWNLALDRHPEVERRIAVFNCRADRPDRSLQLGKACVAWRPPDHVVLMGTGTYLFARAAVSGGMDSSRLVFVEDAKVDQIFETIVSLVGRSALVMGMGNIGGQGLELGRYFRNRSVPGLQPAADPPPVPEQKQVES
jgi:poly-gamma-glutamate synthase PgsB/CapB